LLHPARHGTIAPAKGDQTVAERSFAREVQDLRLGDGDTFRGEGILAVTKALLQSGVGYVAGYQGAPISHLMDVLSDAQEILGELGVHFESSASEAAAAATLAASVNYPIRGAVTWKSTAGTNVACDALSNLASGGVKGGALVVIGEDYGEGSSIMQERTHAFAMKSQIWLLDPRPNLPSIVAAVEHGFALSEASNTPVMLQLRIRACHVHGSFATKANRPPPFTLAQALENPVRDPNRIVLPPASYLHEQEKVRQRWPAAVRYIRAHGLNETFPGDIAELGIITQGGMYNGVVRALQGLGLADIWGATRIPIHVLNVTYPLVDDDLATFCAGKRAVLMVEEGQPEFLEQALNTILRRADIPTRIAGKDVLPMAGEYTAAVLSDGLRAFLAKHAPGIALAEPPDARPTLARPELAALAQAVPPRPPSFCTGCPERPIFAAMKLVQQELGPHHITGDIGCHLFALNEPFNIGSSTMGYGLGPSSAAAFQVQAGKRALSVMGDGGFWHNGLVSGVGNAVYNRHDSVTVIVDNHYSAATGGQDLLSSRAEPKGRSTNHPIETAIRGIGAGWVRRIDRTYDVARMRDTLREALTTKEPGPKFIIASSECMLNRQRRERPLFAAAVRKGERVVKPRFGVDEDVCTGDHACIRLSGCPSLSTRPSGDPLKPDPVAAIDNSCVGCGNCGEVAEAAVLCPSFWRADIVHNPSWWDRALAKLRGGIIAWLQRRRAARVLHAA
jgi:indolepyruvate ferredoxin oxidoreductase alpha subunit